MFDLDKTKQRARNLRNRLPISGWRIEIVPIRQTNPNCPWAYIYNYAVQLNQDAINIMEFYNEETGKAHYSTGFDIGSGGVSCGSLTLIGSFEQLHKYLKRERLNKQPGSIFGYKSLHHYRKTRRDAEKLLEILLTKNYK